ncbi:MAG: hypothetical protein Q6L60_11020, partial [Thermostichus sp. HHBFW_bins_43]
MGPLWRQLVRRWRQMLPLGMLLLALLVVLLLKGCGGGGGVQSLLPPAQNPNPISQPTPGIPSQNPTPIGANPSTPGISTPPGIPLPSQTPTLTPTSPGEPSGPALILNAEALDGIPLTIGQSITLQAASEATEWRDSTGRVLGQGSQLVYTAERVGMETLTAQVGEAGQSQARISFTVSTPEAVIQPHVKVLGDELAETILAFDPTQGILELKADGRLPTLRVGDVVLGAGLRVRPVQILALSEQGEQLRAQVQLALPRQVIKQGVISEWQAVQLGPNGEIQRLPAQGRAGECAHPIRRSLTLPLAGIPSYTDTIVIPSPFPGLKQLESIL